MPALSPHLPFLSTIHRSFFVLYVMFRGFALVPFRLFWPAASVFVFILKWLRIISCELLRVMPLALSWPGCPLRPNAISSLSLGSDGYGGMPTGESHASAALTKDIACPAATGAKVPIDKAMEIPARNLRYSRDIGVIVMAIYVRGGGLREWLASLSSLVQEDRWPELPAPYSAAAPRSPTSLPLISKLIVPRRWRCLRTPPSPPSSSRLG